ncbi:MAG: HD domain-containing protein [Candidatus Omnitrophica bacterium]|nr:HD domain-containing protein [Candidatus Omnitrophota bacterium]
MYNADPNCTNWKDVENLFFNKVLKKEAPGTLYKVDDLIKKQISPDDEKFHRDRRIIADYQEAIFNASRSMIRFKKPQHLIKMIDKIINEKVGVTHSAVLLYDNDRNSYILVDSRGARGKKIPVGYVRLDPRSPLIILFSERKNKFISEGGAIGFRDLKWILESGQLLTKDTSFHNTLRLVLKEMELLDAELCIPCFFKRELLGILILGKKVSGKSFSREETNLFATLANDAAMAIANARLIEHLQKKVDEVGHLYEREHTLFINTAIALATAVDARDAYTHGHAERVTKYCLAIAEEFSNIPEARANGRFKEMLRITALLHDIGKIGIPDSILNKRGKLSEAEKRIVERHPEMGASILAPIPELNDISKFVRFHQEWYNGNGYPNGLKRDEIPIIARIVSVANTFDAITSDRPYRKKKSGEAALKEIKERAGIQFDPQVVDAFVRAYNRRKIDNIGY